MQKRKLEHRDLKSLAQGHVASERGAPGVNSGSHVLSCGEARAARGHISSRVPIHRLRPSRAVNQTYFHFVDEETESQRG